jgi:mRNA interferase RelE/StbE
VIWTVRFTPAAQRQIEALDRPIRDRIAAALARLAGDPGASPNVKALHGGGYRLRVGDWRVLFAREDDALVVLVLRVAHRREAYR